MGYIFPVLSIVFVVLAVNGLWNMYTGLGKFSVNIVMTVIFCALAVFAIRKTFIQSNEKKRKEEEAKAAAAVQASKKERAKQKRMQKREAADKDHD
jgi:mannitol-specific phosphotransferase system IIBC component